jgi:hypothetical protein
VGLNCQPVANDCNVNATALLQAAWVRDLLAEMRLEDKDVLKREFQSSMPSCMSANPTRDGPISSFYRNGHALSDGIESGPACQ